MSTTQAELQARNRPLANRPTSIVANPPADSAAAAVGSASGTRHVVNTQSTGCLLLLLTRRCCEPIARAAAGAVGAASADGLAASVEAVMSLGAPWEPSVAVGLPKASSAPAKWRPHYVLVRLLFAAEIK